MLTHERANMVMFDMRQKMPDTTYKPPRPSIGGVPTPSSVELPSSLGANVVPPAVESVHQMEKVRRKQQQMMTWTIEMVVKIKQMARSFQISWQICGG